LKVGDSRDDVVARFGKPSRVLESAAAPGAVPNWTQLGHILDRGDLDPFETGDKFEYLHYADDQLLFVLHQNSVRAIIVWVRHKAPTARGLDVGASEEQLIHLYPEIPTSVRGVDGPGGSKERIKVYRF